MFFKKGNENSYLDFFFFLEIVLQLICFTTLPITLSCTVILSVELQKISLDFSQNLACCSFFFSTFFFLKNCFLPDSSLFKEAPLWTYEGTGSQLTAVRNICVHIAVLEVFYKKTCAWFSLPVVNVHQFNSKTDYLLQKGWGWSFIGTDRALDRGVVFVCWWCFFFIFIFLGENQCLKLEVCTSHLFR